MLSNEQACDVSSASKRTCKNGSMQVCSKFKETLIFCTFQIIPAGLSRQTGIVLIVSLLISLTAAFTSALTLMHLAAFISEKVKQLHLEEGEGACAVPDDRQQTCLLPSCSGRSLMTAQVFLVPCSYRLDTLVHFIVMIFDMDVTRWQQMRC